MKGSSSTPMIVFLLFWTVGTMFFDVWLVFNTVNRARSHGFQPVPCVIQTSEVTTIHDEGTSHTPEIRFSYSVEGKGYESERIYGGTRTSMSGRQSRQLVALYPAGSQTNAYVNPRNPEEAVLCRGMLGDELFMAMFMTPFNLVMIGLWMAYIKGRRDAKYPPVAGGAKVIMTRAGKRLRLVKVPPLHDAAVGLGAYCFVTIFAVGFTAGFPATSIVMGSVWVGAVVTAALTYAWRHRRAVSGNEDLVIHSDGLRVTLPALCGRKSSEDVLRGDIEQALMEEVKPLNEDGDSVSEYYVVLVLKDGRKLRLVEWLDRDSTESIADWLRSELQLAPPYKAGNH